ncbi:hypothetical protein Hypma_002196 [Hypsizygus marmoreus]|uniref:DUF6699 domain-containing protein n=1 Tax=Hypsizygus marmoreus TaxID=39966 RepID=A0A369K894_HYPMA|nr:hypothetical protein Hypma_002196 [Hypsizygus marmoreus]
MSPLTLHPLLAYSQHNIAVGHCNAILWDLREAPTSIRHVSNLDIVLTEHELSELATTPPVKSLHVVCGLFAEDWPIDARNPQGVTILDVLKAIYTCLQTQITQEEWYRMCLKQRRRVSVVFDARWRVAKDTTITHAHGVLRADCLLQHTLFAGLTVSLETEGTCILTLRCPR